MNTWGHFFKFATTFFSLQTGFEVESERGQQKHSILGLKPGSYVAIKPGFIKKVLELKIQSI